MKKKAAREEGLLYINKPLQFQPVHVIPSGILDLSAYVYGRSSTFRTNVPHDLTNFTWSFLRFLCASRDRMLYFYECIVCIRCYLRRYTRLVFLLDTYLLSCFFLAVRRICSL